MKHHRRVEELRPLYLNLGDPEQNGMTHFCIGNQAQASRSCYYNQHSTPPLGPRGQGTSPLEGATQVLRKPGVPLLFFCWFASSLRQEWR
jgi:hypothetical protein